MSYAQRNKQFVNVLFFFLIFLHVFDGLATYYAVQYLGVEEGNPLVRYQIKQVAQRSALLWAKGSGCCFTVILRSLVNRIPFVFESLVMLVAVYTTLSLIPWSVRLCYAFFS